MSLRNKLKEVKSPSDLTDDEYKILQDQGQLPAGFPIREDLQGPPGVGDDPFHGKANTGTVAVMSTEELEAELERRKALETQPSIGDKGGIVDDDDEDGEEVEYAGLTNKELRALLAERGLSVDGNKDELVARLEEDDASDASE